MNKTELIAAVADKAKLSKKDVALALETTKEVIVKALKKGDKVTIIGFGTFEVRKRSARKGLNPQTKETIKIPATKVPAFKAGKALKEAVAKKK